MNINYSKIIAAMWKGKFSQQQFFLYYFLSVTHLWNLHLFMHCSLKVPLQHFRQVKVWSLTGLLQICCCAWDYCPDAWPTCSQALSVEQMASHTLVLKFLTLRHALVAQESSPILDVIQGPVARGKYVFPDFLAVVSWGFWLSVSEIGCKKRCCTKNLLLIDLVASSLQWLPVISL